MRQALTRGQTIVIARVGPQCQLEQRMRCDGAMATGRYVVRKTGSDRRQDCLGCTVGVEEAGCGYFFGERGQAAALSGGFVPQKMLIESEWRAFASRMTILARGSVFFPGADLRR